MIRYALGARIFLALVVTGMLSGCMDEVASSDSPPPAPQESYVQAPVQNMQLAVRVDWSFAYQPADPNASLVWRTETGPQAILAELNKLGQADGNSFVMAPAGENGQILLNITQYSNGQAGDNYSSSLMGQMYALGHSDMVCTERTGGFLNDAAAADDLAQRIYNWLHNGWHTHN
jgi:hypothetical protein